MKKTIFVVAWLLIGVSLVMAAELRGVTLLMVPARFSVLQVAFDVAARYPVVLVSYQGEAVTENPLLHVWNGREWLYVSLQDFREANFVQITPARALLVGDETVLPQVLVPAVSGWCSEVLTVPALDTAGLVNALGAHLAFNRHDWEWFATRYNMRLEDLNVGRRRESWYDQPGYWDAWTERLRKGLPCRTGRPGRRATMRQISARESLIVPPADVVVTPVGSESRSPEGAPLPISPRISIPPAEEEPAVAVEKPEPAKRKHRKAEPLPAEVPAESPGAIPPPGWQEKATATELPVK